MADPALRFTYTRDPARSTLDAVRFYTGDVERDSAMLDDREIQFAITANPNPRIAAAVLLEELATRFARKADITVGQVSKSFGSIAEQLAKRAADLRNKSFPLPFFGGLTIAGKQELDGRAGDVQPRFRRGQFDNPMALQIDGVSPDSEE